MKELPNPCVRNCCLDDNDVCLGCGRDLETIKRWRTLSEGERRFCMLKAKRRLQQQALSKLTSSGDG